MFHGVKAIHDLGGLLEVVSAHFFKSEGPVNEQHDLVRLTHATAQGLAPQPDAEIRRAFKSGQIGGGLVIAQGAARLVELVLGKHAAQGRHAGFGLTVGSLAFSALQFLAPHGQAGVVGFNIEDGGVTGLGRTFPAQPGGSLWAQPQHLALDLAFADDNATDFLKMDLGFPITGFVGALQADEAG